MTVKDVADKLGGKKVLRREIASELELADAVHSGFPAESLKYILGELAHAAGSQRVVYNLIGSARTLQRKRTEHALLSIAESDRLARLARLIVRTEQALGDKTKARHWLTTPNRALGGKHPLSLLGSDPGALAVERVLGRIEHGVYS